MRQIKFRGKNSIGDWWYGNLITREYLKDGQTKHIYEISDITTSNFCTGIIPETVGQFTGLTDKNGKEIYDGDIIEDKNGIGVIMWFQTAWGVASYAHGYNGLKSYTAVDSFYSKETKEWAVIGSIHDDPELLTK